MFLERRTLECSISRKGNASLVTSIYNTPLTYTDDKHRIQLLFLQAPWSCGKFKYQSRLGVSHLVVAMCIFLVQLSWWQHPNCNRGLFLQTSPGGSPFLRLWTNSRGKKGGVSWMKSMPCCHSFCLLIQGWGHPLFLSAPDCWKEA